MIAVTSAPEDARAITISRSRCIYTFEDETQLFVWLSQQTHPDGSIIEIGCAAGDTTAELAIANPKRIVYGLDYTGPIDLHEDQRDEQPTEDTILDQCSTLDNVIPIDIKASSHLYYDLAGPCSFILIDADHRYNAVKADTEKAIDHIKSHELRPAIIAWHDVYGDPPEWVQWVGVWTYLQELAEKYNITVYEDTRCASLTFK